MHEIDAQAVRDALRTEDISRYGRKTQERILAAQTPRIVIRHYDGALVQNVAAGSIVMSRQIALAQAVREAEDRAATAYAATFVRTLDDMAVAQAMREDGQGALTDPGLSCYCATNERHPYAYSRLCLVSHDHSAPNVCQWGCLDI